MVDPRSSPGVVLGNGSLPMSGVVFEDVVFQNPPDDGPWGTDYFYTGPPGVEPPVYPSLIDPPSKR